MEGVTASIVFQMSLLLFVALAGYLIASRLNQSAVIGEILVGIIVGPSVLGLITYTDFVQGLALIGAVILLFVIGFEFNPKDLLDIRYGIIALLGVIVPWIGGYGVSVLFGYNTVSAIFVGTALTATSIAITANVLQEMGKLQTEAAKAIIGAAVIDDVLGLIALSITGDVVSGALSIASVALVVIKAIAFIGIGGAIGYFVISKVLIKIDKTPLAQKYPEFVFMSALMVAFFYAFIAELVGLSAIVGAFIAGVSFCEVCLVHSKDIREGAEYLQVIFAAIFFVSLGVLADFRALTPEIILFLVVITVVAILTKVIGCGIPAKLLGWARRDSLIIGFGMSPRGEVAMIVALIGLTEAYIDQGLYVSLVLMSLLTTIVTPILFRNWLYKGEAPLNGQPVLSQE
jgi:Kef-type K+ transport system membrane component KefB